ncbi:hypothetical protein ISN45_At02g016090, partial [Arabidopsis thaliana x Arabidopsis arenosa]
ESGCCRRRGTLKFKRQRFATMKRLDATRDLMFGSWMDMWRRCGITFGDGA